MRLATIVLAVGIGVATAGGQDPRAGVCVGNWSKPIPILRGDARPVYIERGAIAPMGDRTLAAGIPTFYWLGKDEMVPASALKDTAQIVWSLTRAGGVIDSAGLSVAVPPIDSTQFRDDPSLLGWTASRASVLWRLADTAPTQRTSGVFGAIEVASFDGKAWTVPQTVMRARHIEMIPLPVFRAGVPFDLSVVGAKGRDSSGDFIRVARHVGPDWSAVEWRGAIFVHYVAAFRAADGSVAVVMMAYPKAGGDGVYGLRAEFTTDGVKWSEPVRIDSIRSSFQQFTSAQLGGDSLLIAWYQSPEGGAPRALLTVLSVDGGKTWRHTTPLVPTGSMDGERFVVDADGRVHLVYRGATEDGVLNASGRIMTAMWLNGSWTKPIPISTEESFTVPSAGSAPRGRIMAMWTDGTVVRGGLSPKSIASLWTPGCSAK